LATNGYFQHGIGVKEQSLGGAAIAYPQSVMSVATNPASASVIGERLDLGIDWFSPHRSADNGDGSGYHKSRCENFFIPQLGYSYSLSERLSLAFVAYANGGMQTDWPKNFFGTTNTSSDLEQVVIAPSLAFSVTPNHSLGVSANYIRQTFKVSGVQGLTTNGEDVSTGWGMRFGYLGQVSPFLKVGAFWQPKTHMKKFDDYRDLFPGDGTFDIPETFGAGLAVELSEKIHIATDLVTIKYSDIPALGNLSTDIERGFGWQDITVIKFGVAYDYSPALILRIGWNHGDTPLRSSETVINILSPATIEDHLTLGFSWMLTESSELSMTYWHGFENEVKGDLTAPVGASDKANVKMYQDNLGIAYSWLF